MTGMEEELGCWFLATHWAIRKGQRPRVFKRISPWQLRQ